MDGDVAVACLGPASGEGESPGVEGADDGVEPDDPVGERAAPVGTLGLRRGDATPAQAEHGDVVSGLLLLHASVSTDEIVVWADLFVDDGPQERTLTARAPVQLLDDRLRRVSALVRRLISTLRVRPDLPALSIVSDLVKIAEVAEGE